MQKELVELAESIKAGVSRVRRGMEEEEALGDWC